VVALFGGLHPLWSIPASILFGALLVGANKMQRVVQVPSALITALNGLVVVFVVSSEIIRKRRIRRRLAIAKQEENPPPPSNDKQINQAEAGA
jgi:simple sugar transport system permease protein